MLRLTEGVCLQMPRPFLVAALVFPQPPQRQTVLLDCYWGGSLDFNFWLKSKCFPLSPQKVKLFAGGSTATNFAMTGNQTEDRGAEYATGAAAGRDARLSKPGGCGPVFFGGGTPSFARLF